MNWSLPISVALSHLTLSWCPLLLLFSHYIAFDFFVTSRSVAYQAPLSTGFPRQEYWSGLPFLSLGDLPNPGSET